MRCSFSKRCTLLSHTGCRGKNSDISFKGSIRIKEKTSCLPLDTSILNTDTDAMTSYFFKQ